MLPKVPTLSISTTEPSHSRLISARGLREATSTTTYHPSVSSIAECGSRPKASVRPWLQLIDAQGACDLELRVPQTRTASAAHRRQLLTRPWTHALLGEAGCVRHRLAATGRIGFNEAGLRRLLCADPETSNALGRQTNDGQIDAQKLVGIHLLHLVAIHSACGCAYEALAVDIGQPCLSS